MTTSTASATALPPTAGTSAAGAPTGPLPESGAGGPDPAGGSAVPSLSPSRAADFMTCPLLYRFRTIDRLPERPSVAATRGTVVHAVLERVFTLRPTERTPQQALALLRPVWDELAQAEPELATLFDADGGVDLDAWLASAADLLGAWFDLEDPTRLAPAATELAVEAWLDSGLRLRGIIDRLDVAPTGEVRVVDYKTGRAPDEAFEGKALFQMKFYGLVLWLTRGVVPRELQLVYLGDRQVLRYRPTEDDLRAVARKVDALWRAIARATETGDWRASPSRLCQWCDHQALCPAFGGTPPPLPLPAPPSPAVPVPAAGVPDGPAPPGSDRCPVRPLPVAG